MEGGAGCAGAGDARAACGCGGSDDAASGRVLRVAEGSLVLVRRWVTEGGFGCVVRGARCDSNTARGRKAGSAHRGHSRASGFGVEIAVRSRRAAGGLETAAPPVFGGRKWFVHSGLALHRLLLRRRNAAESGNSAHGKMQDARCISARNGAAGRCKEWCRVCLRVTCTLRGLCHQFSSSPLLSRSPLQEIRNRVVVTCEEVIFNYRSNPLLYFDMLSQSYLRAAYLSLPT
jgi:hypothetical protein